VARHSLSAASTSQPSLDLSWLDRFRPLDPKAFSSVSFPSILQLKTVHQITEFFVMCHFITMVFPASADTNLLAELFRRRHRSMERLTNPHVTTQLRPDEMYVQPAPKMCDCGTSLGSLRRGTEPPRVERRETEQLRRKGWSGAKIDRWLQQQTQYLERIRQEKESRESAARGADPDSWCQTISELLALPGVGYAGILLHWYSGGIQSERIQLADRRRVRVDSSTPDFLHNIDEDILYEFYS